jgi:hypothetical protein
MVAMKARDMTSEQLAQFKDWCAKRGVDASKGACLMCDFSMGGDEPAIGGICAVCRANAGKVEAK